jgi:hypothetical protein
MSERINLPTYYYLPAGELQPATNEEKQVYLRKADAFVKSTGHYQETPERNSAAVVAVAEYIAYQEDKTIRTYGRTDV